MRNLIIVILFLFPVLIFSISFQNDYFIENPALASRFGVGVQTYYSSPTDYAFCLGLLSSRLIYKNGKYSYSTALGLNGFSIGYGSEGLYGIAYKNDNFYLGLLDSTQHITRLSSSTFSLHTGVSYDPFYLDAKTSLEGTKLSYSLGGGLTLNGFNLDFDYSPKDFLSVGAFYQNKFIGFGGDYILKYGSLENIPYYRIYFSIGNWVEPRKNSYFIFASIDSKTESLLSKNSYIDKIILSLNNYSKDTYCKGILMRLGFLDDSLLNLGMIEELRSSIGNFKNSGKKVIFYLESDSSFLTYYLATAGTKIYMPPLSNLYSLGYTLNIYKWGDFLRMLGIDVQEITAGKYKSTFHSNVSQLSEEQKDGVKKIVQSVYDRALYDISKDRAIDPVTLENFMNGRMVSATVAQDNKLIDSVGYFADALNEFNGIEEKNFIPNFKSNNGLFAKNVYILPISGTIAQGGDFSLPGYTTDEWAVNRLSQIENDPNVGAVILRINSPGGSAIASEHIWRKLDELRRRGIYTIASMEGVAASGGYYIASGCDTIVANPMTITGNIGVVYQIVDYSSLLNKLKIREYTIKTGFYDDMYNGTRPLTPDERSKIQQVVNYSYNLFLKRVSQSRRIPLKDMQSIADGKIYTGKMALSKDIKLVDYLGGLNKAIDLAKNYVNSGINLVYIQSTPSIVDYIRNFFEPFNILSDGLYMY